MAAFVIREEQEKAYGRLTIGLSVAIPLAVMALLGLPRKVDLGAWTSGLPHVIAAINSLTAALIVLGVLAIKRKNVAVHRKAMQTAFGLGVAFLVAYVLYHLTNPSTKYGGTGPLRGVYFFVLASHIILSIGVVPLVLRAMFLALSNQVARHRAVVRWAAPLWLYVSVTGVIAYAMIRPFYRLGRRVSRGLLRSSRRRPQADLSRPSSSCPSTPPYDTGLPPLRPRRAGLSPAAPHRRPRPNAPHHGSRRGTRGAVSRHPLLHRPRPRAHAAERCVRGARRGGRLPPMRALYLRR